MCSHSTINTYTSSIAALCFSVLSSLPHCPFFTLRLWTLEDNTFCTAISLEPGTQQWPNSHYILKLCHPLPHADEAAVGLDQDAGCWVVTQKEKNFAWGEDLRAWGHLPWPLCEIEGTGWGSRSPCEVGSYGHSSYSVPCILPLIGNFEEKGCLTVRNKLSNGEQILCREDWTLEKISLRL